MNEFSFYRLLDILAPHMSSPHKDRFRHTKNPDIETDLKLSIALQYFAGGDPYDIMISHGVSHSIIIECIWEVVDAVNQTSRLAIQFPNSYKTQKKMAEEFQAKSQSNFNSCVGCIDGMLV